MAIESDPALNPSLDTLAGHACLSPFHFHRVFRAIVGENPAEYLPAPAPNFATSAHTKASPTFARFVAWAPPDVLAPRPATGCCFWACCWQRD